MQEHLGFDGEQILVRDWAYLQRAKESAVKNRQQDFWTDGIVQDGLSNFFLTIDGTTSTLLNVGAGVGYINGERVAISANQAYSAASPTATTNGICTPQSTGNRGVPLANYAAGVDNNIWIQYLQGLNTFPFDVHPITGTLQFPQATDAYRIVVNTTNGYGNTQGLTNALYLGKVAAQGVGVPLISSGISYSNRRYAKLATTNGLCVEGNATINGTVDAAGHKVVNLATATAAADAVRFDQIVQTGVYQRPRLEWANTTSVNLENNTTTADQTVLRFPDGTFRTVTENLSSTDKYRRFKITSVAEYTSGTESGGMRNGLTWGQNSWYGLYGVKSQINSSNFVMVADTTLPGLTSSSVLDGYYGADAWVYLGLIRSGLNAGTFNNYLSQLETNIVKFQQVGSRTEFMPFTTQAMSLPSTPVQVVVDGGVLLGGASVTTSINGITVYQPVVGMGKTSLPDTVAATHMKVHLYKGSGTAWSQLTWVADTPVQPVTTTGFWSFPGGAGTHYSQLLATDTFTAISIAPDQAAVLALMRSFADNLNLVAGLNEAFPSLASGDFGYALDLPYWPATRGVFCKYGGSNVLVNFPNSAFFSATLLGFHDKYLDYPGYPYS